VFLLPVIARAPGSVRFSNPPLSAIDPLEFQRVFSLLGLRRLGLKALLLYYSTVKYSPENDHIFTGDEKWSIILNNRIIIQ